MAREFDTIVVIITEFAENNDGYVDKCACFELKQVLYNKYSYPVESNTFYQL